MTCRNRGAARPRSIFALLLVLVAAACTSDDAPIGGRTLMQMARELGSDVMRTLVRGYVPDRSGEVVVVTKPWNVLGQWNGGLRGDRDPRTSHSSPWSYHQRVPISLFGPGYVRGPVRVDRPVTVADIAPTLAELVGLRFEAPNGRVLREALVPRARRPERPPRAIVVVAVDGGGWNVLSQWPDAWPFQRSLMRDGTVFANATVGSAPTVTAPIHATIGTGAFPRVHGIPENTGRLPDGSLGKITGNGDLSMVRGDTFADAWDRANGHRAWVGMLGYATWHLTMMGKGALAGDRDVAVLWDDDAERFTTNPANYVLPSYLPDRSVLDQHVRALDAADGAIDDRWGEETLDELAYTFTANPAFAAYQGDAILEIARRAPLGRDRVTDLFYVELKTGDVAGHVWNMVEDEVRTVLEEQDRIVEQLVQMLDERIGRGRYVLVMTADHGQTPIPEDSGGLRVDRFRLHDDLNDRFDDAVESVHPSDLYLTADADVSLEDLARYIGEYRFADGLPEGTDQGAIPPDVLAERVFAGAFPGPFLLGLTEEEIDALGPGIYGEGDLRSPSAEVAQTLR